MKNTILSLITILTLTMLPSCSDSTTTKTTTDVSISELDGKSLMESNCIICHGAGASHDDLLAPPMMGVKNHYLEDGMSEEDFINSIVEWTKNPAEETSKMPGAIDKFNVMPKQYFDTDEVKAIASYMFNNELEKPQWFDKHMAEEHGEFTIEGLELDNGEKWEANPETTSGINKMIEITIQINENPTIEDYQNIALKLETLKSDILNQCTMSGIAHDNLHSFLMPLIRKINGLKEIETIEKGEKIFSRIQLHLAQYTEFFI